MIITNYDTSSTGFNCELYVMFDCDQGRTDFEDEMHVHQYDGYSTTAVYEFGVHEEAPADSVSDLFEFSDDLTEREFRRALFNIYKDEATEYWTPTARDFFDEFGVGNVDWREAFMEKLEEDFSIPEYAKEESFPLIDELPSDKVTHLYRVKSTSGYSQGDYALVLVPNKHGWDDEHKSSIDKAIDHICWDQPVYARLEVTNQETGETDEIYLEELLDDRYEWDRDKIMEGIKKLGGGEPEGAAVTRNAPLPSCVIEWVEESLPEYPEVS
jgi:hypothetical protein